MPALLRARISLELGPVRIAKMRAVRRQVVVDAHMWGGVLGTPGNGNYGQVRQPFRLQVARKHICAQVVEVYAESKLSKKSAPTANSMMAKLTLTAAGYAAL